MSDISFYGIGAMKSGTTWLWARLSELPAYSLPYVKELHYFNRSKEYPIPYALSPAKFLDRVKKPSWVYMEGKRTLDALRRGNMHEVKWMANYCLPEYTDNWYRSLFTDLPGISGDITPAYSMLKEKDIERMRTISPDARIIFLIRNPIDRAWSHYRHTINKGRIANYTEDEAFDLENLREFLDSDGQELRTDYIRTLRAYGNCFDPNRILIGFFDAIVHDPRALLADIVDFTGGDPAAIDRHCKLRKVSNPSPKVRIPREIEDQLKAKYEPMMARLAEEFGGYCTYWYRRTFEDDYTPPAAIDFPATLIYRGNFS
ncbi:sulfotransferase family protein [Neolewinella xylanilytica]|uniref:Sulfotransferase family protein n=1 Tax=Neolewinella xylanilytica TaxID=1514080 RepID=A0A2S6I8X1_9BACT|nr:sulfotransferase [Neolewinella xylanilytica]PPK87941.1 sulfotransferase family protein [Neolewinella xylanilytica]